MQGPHNGEGWPPLLIIIFIVFVLASLFLGISLGVLLHKYIFKRNIDDAHSSAEGIIESAKKEAETLKKELLLDSKEQNTRYRAKIEDELHSRRIVADEQEKRLNIREEKLERRDSLLEKKELQISNQDNLLQAKQQRTDKLYEEAQRVVAQQYDKLEEVAQLSKEEAKDLIITDLKADLVKERAKIVRESEAHVKAESNRIAKDIVVQAIERSAADIVVDSTVSVVELPDEDMKGRIIGREGRNIRSFQDLTGVDLIVDETPKAVILSSFDPARREIARLTLNKLIVDGRIHPGKIEEIYNRAQKDFDEDIHEIGDQTLYDLDIHDMNPELVKLVGRMRYRTSYGQNVLAHSIQVALLTGTMASEIGEDEMMARRAGLLHDIGKSIDHEVEGSHVEIGVEIAQRYHEPKQVVNAIASHHGDVPATSAISVLVSAADAISAARPGARSESLENYIHRLEKLESLVNGFNGVKQSYAIQAGREVRVIVSPESISDDETVLLAREIKEKIENNLSYPGHIKVSVIREFRAVEVAS